MRPLDADDLVEIVELGPVDVSCHGTIAYVATHLDVAADRARSRICFDGAVEEDATSPVWSPDGTMLAFLSSRESEVDQLYVRTTVRDATSRRLTDVATGVSSAAWSPDGRSLALAACALFVVPLAGGDAAALTDGNARDMAPAWSPDGEQIAFARGAAGVSDEPERAVCVLSLGDAHVRRASDRLAFATAPSWSPDGRRIACLGMRERRLGSADPAMQVWILDPGGAAEPRAVTSPDDGVVAARGPLWSADGRTLVVGRAVRGRIELIRVGVDDGRVTPLAGGDRHVTSWGFDGGSEVCAFVATHGTPAELHVADVDGAGPERRVTTVNAHMTTRYRWPEAEMRTFAGPDGGTVDGLLLRPPDARAPTPLLLALHGGPHAFVGPGFAGGHFFRYVLASRGWTVLAVNASGSSSYGLEFADRLRGNWGERDLPEHLAAMDALIDEGIADPDRLAVAGYSYGGYLAAWAIAHTDRFKAAVVGAPIADLKSFWATSDIGSWFTPFELLGDPAERPEEYRRLSPLTHAARIRTPTLLVHGEDDRRCPIAQSEQLHSALASAGRAPVELVRYPGADHLFFRSGRPRPRIDYNGRVVDWLERHVNGR